MCFSTLILRDSIRRIMISYPLHLTYFLDKFFSIHPFIFDRIFPSVSRILTIRISRFNPTTFPLPSGVAVLFKVRGVLFPLSRIFLRSHIADSTSSVPHKPEILLDSKIEAFDLLPFLIDTNKKSPKKKNSIMDAHMDQIPLLHYHCFIAGHQFCRELNTSTKYNGQGPQFL